ncbi:hypothetical protein Ddc_05093 [Ditylenchus destructor]|nr:hypothetical protein Ddc_05093 [Ditylenchus destructor]
MVHENIFIDTSERVASKHNCSNHKQNSSRRSLELYHTRDQYVAPSDVHPLPTLYNYESLLRRLSQQQELQSVNSSDKIENANFDTSEESSMERQRAKRRLVVRVSGKKTRFLTTFVFGTTPNHDLTSLLAELM